MISIDPLQHRGAYGFRLVYPDTADGAHLTDLVVQDETAPDVTVTWRFASTTEDVEEVADDRVVYGNRGGTTFHVERSPRSIRFDLQPPLVLGALIHPLLTVGIAVHARWRGDITLHAGAFQSSTGAWAVMGARQAGKSALLAGLASRGRPIVADDLLAIQDGTVWAGPSCVDLRPDTADRFEGAWLLGTVGGRPRFRLSTPQGLPRVPLRGFLVLDWHDRPTVATGLLGARERLEWIYRQEYISLVGWPDPAKLVPLLGLPVWRVTRPADWAATDDVVDRVLEIADNPG